MKPFRCLGQSAIALVFCLTTMLLAESRLWTSTDGRTLEAEFLRQQEGSVTLRRSADGRVFDIPLAGLSQADRDFVAQQSETAEKPAAEPGIVGFPAGGLVWPGKVRVPGDFEVEILEENNNIGVYRYRAGSFTFTSDVKLARKVVGDFAKVFEGTFLAVQAMPLDWDIQPPEAGYAVRLFAKYSDYIDAGGMPGSAGVYIRRERVILVPMESLGVKKSSSGVTLSGEGHGTLIHEITHQLQHDWMVKLPVWMSEGFAEYMQAVPFSRGTFDFGDLDPLKTLQSESRFGKEFAVVPLETLMTMNHAEWNSRFGSDAYALRRQYVTAFLLVYYFAHLDGDGGGRRLWEALRVMEAVRTTAQWHEANKHMLDILRDGRSYEALFQDMQRAYRSKGLKLVGG